MSRRALSVGALAAVTAGGYYLYQAGGDPKVAQKEVEHDVISAKSRLKGEDVSSETARKQGEEIGVQAGKKLDSAVDDANSKFRAADHQIRSKASEAEGRVLQLKSDSIVKLDETRKDAGKKIDEIDNKIEKKTSEAKSGISSWFGFGK